MSQLQTYSVPAISCAHCEASITDSVSKVADVAKVVVNLDTKQVSVTGGDDEEIRAAIDRAGYDVA